MVTTLSDQELSLAPAHPPSYFWFRGSSGLTTSGSQRYLCPSPATLAPLGEYCFTRMHGWPAGPAYAPPPAAVTCYRWVPTHT